MFVYISVQKDVWMYMSPFTKAASIEPPLSCREINKRLDSLETTLAVTVLLCKGKPEIQKAMTRLTTSWNTETLDNYSLKTERNCEIECRDFTDSRIRGQWLPIRLEFGRSRTV